MSFAEKANLAQHYTNLFDNHLMVYMIFSILVVILTVILGAIFLALYEYLVRKYHFRNSKSYIFVSSIIVIIIAWLLACCLGRPMDVTDSDFENYSGNTHHDEDHRIVKYGHQLPRLQRKASVNYKHSLKLHGAKAFSADHAYYKNHNKVKYMRHYLETHNPKAPWINHKF